MVRGCFVPSGEGRAALAELDRVAWGELTHAYGRGVTGDGITHDVRGALARLGDPDRDAISIAVSALTCNVCHQGTIYEVTAHAVPFIAAVAADPTVWIGHVRELMCLLGCIAIASSFETEDGTMSGSFGDDVAESTRMAVGASAALLTRAGSVHATLAVVAEATKMLTTTGPTRARMDELAQAIEAAESLELGDPPRPPLPERWVTHAKFGRGLVVQRSDGKSRVKFDDGTERTLLDRVLADCPRAE